MPIRINLLAEAQAQLEQRRKDPVKRAILAAVGLVVVVVAWTGMLIWQGAMKQSEMASLQQKLQDLKPRHEQIKRNDLLAVETRRKVEQLHFYATNRFLWAPVLNALTQVATNSFATNITISRLDAEQTFVAAPAVKGVTNATGQVVTPARREGVIERNRMMVDARDYGPEMDQTYERWRRAIPEAAYFKGILDPRNPVGLERLTRGAADPLQPGSQAFQTFVLRVNFVEKFREN